MGDIDGDAGPDAGVDARVEANVDVDVVVVGGGPAGLVTAINLALLGSRVRVLEPRGTPIDKACGEGLMPSAVQRLHRLGVHLDIPEHGLAFHGIRYVDARRGEEAGVAEARFRHGSGVGVRRTTLHRALVDRALELNVELVAAQAREFHQTSGAVEVDGVRARYLVGADGLHSGVRRRSGIAAGSPGPSRFGLRRHFPIQPWSDLVEVHWSAHSEAYLTPVAPDLLGVAILSSSRGPFDEQLKAFPALHRRLAETTGTHALGSGPLRQDVERRTHGRIALVGDAAGYVDALTGEGLNVAFATAEDLARCIAADRLEDYERLWRASSRRYRIMTRGLLWARLHAGVDTRIVPAAARFPRLFAAAVDQLA